MSAVIGQSERKFEAHVPALTARDLVLLRIAAGTATRADLQRDVAPLLAPKFSGAEFRRSAELGISNLIGSQLVAETKGRLSATGKGLQVAEALLASAKAPCATWVDVKLALVLRALRTSDTPAIRKALQRVEGLAAIVLQDHFGKSTGRAQSPADLRADLAIIALERAFGNKIKTGFKKGAGLPAKPGRVLAGPATSGNAAYRAFAHAKTGQRPRPDLRDRAAKPAFAVAAGHARILSRCDRCGTTCLRGLARQPEGVYLFGLEGDSQHAARLGVIRDCVQRHARGSPPFGSGRTRDRRSQGRPRPEIA